ncbi:hypothetical protein L1987_26663 [Smallanthus sonchifolius]|uniref:Uncharacterized protein n=1 Tax=Smallanthus sonchifolius TaxID=185202 RepID=A0ACB9IAJ4_9ASTR|nr:hypothetical protein L1987_26663 [Smallanthus sonchifolius]
MAHLLPPITVISIDSSHNKFTICWLISSVAIARPLVTTLFKPISYYNQTLIYTNTTKPMSRSYSNPPPLVQNQEILIDEPSNEPKGSSFPSQKQNSSPDFIQKGSEPTFIIGKDYQEDDVEDEESEFKMGRLIRQASLNSSHMSTPQQTTKVKLTGSSSLPRYLSLKPETNQEKVKNMRKVESMNGRNRNKSSKKIGKNSGGAPTIPGGWVDTGKSEDMKAQIKFWARAVAFNLHQEC